MKFNANPFYLTNQDYNCYQHTIIC